MCDASPQQSYAMFVAHLDRLHTPTRLVFCYPATEHSLQMARDRVTDALYDLNTPMKVIAKWLTYIEDAAPDMAVDEVWAWAVLDWSELITALDDDDVSHAFVDMSHALHVRGVECALDDAILDAFKEAHILVAQTLAGKPAHAKMNKMLKSWWSSPIVPPSVISNANLANGNPILGNTQSDHAAAYPGHQRAFYRSVVTYVWQAATEQRLEAIVRSVADDDASAAAMEAIAEQDAPHVDADTCAETLSDADVESCTYTSPSTAPAAPDSASPDAPVDIYESSSPSVVAKWPLEPLAKDSGVWSVMELLTVAPVAELAYRPSWLERCAHQAVQGEPDTAAEIDDVPTCDLNDGSLLSQRRHSDADSLCSLTTIPFSDVDEEELEELTAPVPCGKTLVAPLDDWMALRGEAGDDDDDEDDEWDVYAPVTKKPDEPLPWFVDAVQLTLSTKPDCISMMDESLRVNVFTDESEGIESEFNRLVCEIKRRRLAAP